MGKPLILELKQNLNYSAQEIDTGKKWINGKTIYRKVVTLTTSTEQQTIAHNIANVENIWVTGDSFFSIDEISIPANYYRDSGIYAYIHVNKNNILFRVSPAGWANHNLYAILEYTKTTD